MNVFLFFWKTAFRRRTVKYSLWQLHEKENHMQTCRELPCPAPCPACPLPWVPVSQAAVRLPAVKVTLPAAMDYTGAHSQAEYDPALEGRSEAQDGRDEAPGPHRDQPLTYSFSLFYPQTTKRQQFASAVCPWLLCMFTTEVCEQEPSGIRGAVMGRQQPEMSHNAPSRNKREFNPVVFIRWYQRAFKRAFITLFFEPEFKDGEGGGGGGVAPFILQNGAMRVSFPLNRTRVIWQSISLESCQWLKVARGKYISIYIYLYLYIYIYICTLHTDILGRSCCPSLPWLSLLWP